ncbi:unnamed protein product, partial [Amoebophrya sp. A25]|eukprot:GSA25T00025647001.1
MRGFCPSSSSTSRFRGATTNSLCGAKDYHFNLCSRPFSTRKYEKDKRWEARAANPFRYAQEMDNSRESLQRKIE